MGMCNEWGQFPLRCQIYQVKMAILGPMFLFNGSDCGTRTICVCSGGKSQLPGVYEYYFSLLCLGKWDHKGIFKAS